MYRTAFEKSRINEKGRLELDVGMNERGLTIIELVLIVAIIASMFMIAAPLFESRSKSVGIEDQAARISAQIRRVRQHALDLGAEFRMVFLQGSDTIEVFYEARPGVELEDASLKLTLDRSTDLVETTFPNNTLRINLLGEPSEGGSVLIRNTRREEARVKIDKETGKTTSTVSE